ncbi:MAG: DUF6797 domain-containing protein [Pirellulales bacterium]
MLRSRSARLAAAFVLLYIAHSDEALAQRVRRRNVPPGDPAWTPPPVAGDAAPWEKHTDADWIDDRLRRMDTGPVFQATMDYPSLDGATRVYKATAIRVGEQGQGAVVFDRNQCRIAAGWTGGFLQHSERRFGLLNTPTPDGTMVFRTASGPGWADPQGRWETPDRATAPLPRAWVHYRGLYLHGPRVALSYTVGDTPVLESPWLVEHAGQPVFTRMLAVGPTERPLELLVAEFKQAGKLREFDGASAVQSPADEPTLTVALAAEPDAAKLSARKDGRVVVSLPPSRDTRRITLLLSSRVEAAALARLAKETKPEDLQPLLAPGPARWTQPIVTQGENAADNASLVVDTLSVPHENPHHALMFLGGLDFLPGGELAVCSAHGDVWLVRGVGERLGQLTWKRFATGLYQPLGLKVVNGLIHVIERGQLTRLHDANGDGEADFYENVNHDWHTGGGEHSYDTCLETDPQGNFYFFKTGDTDTPTGGCLMRVAADGSRAEIFATGFRHPIGLGMSPAGLITGADQQGNWMPATRVDLIHQGGFYGDMRAHHREQAPATYDPPLCWLPREADNSAGGQVWVPPNCFGPLAGRPLHLSYGRCRMLLLLPQIEGEHAQGGAVDLGLFFLSGVARGRINPRDGHLYVCGLRGWQNAAKQDGCLQRVRYTGQPLRLPVGLKVVPGGLELEFSTPLGKSAADPRKFRVEQWNYRWSEEYGSKDWSVAKPEQEGRDLVKIAAARLLPDGRTVRLSISDLAPVMQMRVIYEVESADGQAVSGRVWNTVNWVPEH